MTLKVSGPELDVVRDQYNEPWARSAHELLLAQEQASDLLAWERHTRTGRVHAGSNRPYAFERVEVHVDLDGARRLLGELRAIDERVMQHVFVTALSREAAEEIAPFWRPGSIGIYRRGEDVELLSDARREEGLTDARAQQAEWLAGLRERAKGARKAAQPADGYDDLFTGVWPVETIAGRPYVVLGVHGQMIHAIDLRIAAPELIGADRVQVWIATGDPEDDYYQVAAVGADAPPYWKTARADNFVVNVPGEAVEDTMDHLGIEETTRRQQ